MKTSLKANLLKHLIAKKDNGGFTLIELLVVIIIIGILAAIALPSFLNQANRARQSEARTYIGSMNRAQQAYYLERTAFTDSLAALGLGIPETTNYYTYEPVLGEFRVTNRGIAIDQGTGTGDSPVRSYVGGVTVGVASVGEETVEGEARPITEATTLAILCEADAAPVNNGPTGADALIDRQTVDGLEGQPVCPGQYTSL